MARRNRGIPSREVRGTYPNFISEVVVNLPRNMDERLELAWSLHGKALGAYLAKLSDPLLFLQATGNLINTLICPELSSWDALPPHVSTRFRAVCPAPSVGREITLALLSAQLFGMRSWTWGEAMGQGHNWGLGLAPEVAPFFASYVRRCPPMHMASFVFAHGVGQPFGIGKDEVIVVNGYDTDIVSKSDLLGHHVFVFAVPDDLTK